MEMLVAVESIDTFVVDAGFENVDLVLVGEEMESFVVDRNSLLQDGLQCHRQEKSLVVLQKKKPLLFQGFHNTSVTHLNSCTS